jgi:aminoglycoside phosphotransferase (APT) family kinase protein
MIRTGGAYNAQGKKRNVVKLKLLCSYGFLVATVSTLSIPVRVLTTKHAYAFSLGQSLLHGTASFRGGVDDDDVPIEFAEEYLKDNGYTMEPFQVAQGTGGFNNRLYQVHNSTHTYLLKLFSELAKERIALSYPIDAKLGELGLGPHISNSYYPMAILMEFIPAPTLTEGDLFQSPPNERLLQDVAVALSSLHSLPPPPGFESSTTSSSSSIPRDRNILWRSIHLLLDRINRPDKKEYFTEQVQRHYSRLEEEFRLPMVTWGHGDCKPSNIILTADHGEVCFLDLELTGYNYRAYDLAKLLFRHSLPSDVDSTIPGRCQDCVLRAYLSSSCSDNNNNNNNDVVDIHASMEQLRIECNLLLPMTWLEAALFFEATKETVAEEDKKQEWERLAQNRLENYQKACQAPSFLESIEAYQQIILLEQR